MKSGQYYYDLMPQSIRDEWENEVNRTYGNGKTAIKKRFHYKSFESFIMRSFSILHTKKGLEYWECVMAGFDQTTGETFCHETQIKKVIQIKIAI